MYELRGAPRERGRAYGEAARALIAALVHQHFAFLEFSAEYVLNTTLAREEILRVTDQYRPACERFAPDLVEELRGIAEGSRIPFREILSLNTFIDIADMVRPETAGNYSTALQSAPRTTSQLDAASFGCTSFGAMPPATSDGNIYLGQNFDTKAAFEPYVCALKLKGASELEPDAVVATFAGMVGCTGINEAGLGVVINHLHTYDARPGVPFTFTMRAMLRETNVDAAIRRLAQSEPASGIHYLVGDPHTLHGVETSATKFEILNATDGWLAHANHCDAPALKQVEVEASVYSLERGARACQMLRNNAGKVNASSLTDIARDHIGANDTICSHAEADAPRLRQYKTDFAVVLDTHERIMDLFVGSPCENRVIRIEV